MTEADQRAAFQKALAANRHDSATRLVFSDWLEERGMDDEAAEQRRMATPEWSESARWMEGFAEKCGHTCPSYPHGEEDELAWEKITFDTVMEAGVTWVTSLNRDFHYIYDGKFWGDPFVQMGQEGARNLMYKDGMRELYWHHWQVITGKRLEAEEMGQPFSCSC